MLEMERQRTAQLNQRLIEAEEANKVLEMIVEKLKENVENQSRQKMQEYISQLQQKIEEQESKRVQLEQSIRQLSTQKQELRQELRQQREQQNRQIMQAIQAQCQRYTREIDELASMYESNQKIMKNNMRMTQENLNEKLDTAIVEKEKLNEVIHQLKQQLTDIKKQYQSSCQLNTEQESEINRLSKMIAQESERFAKEESEMQSELAIKHKQIEYLKTRLSKSHEQRQEQEQKQEFLDQLPDRFDIDSDLVESMRKQYEQVLIQNSKLKERVRELQSNEPNQGKALTKAKSTQSLNIFKQLQNGNWAQNAFKYRGSGSVSQKSQDDDVEKLRDEVNILREQVDNLQHKNEKLLAKYNDAVKETANLSKLYMTEQQNRLILRRKVEQVHNLHKEMERLNKTIQTLCKERQQWKSKISLLESKLRGQDITIDRKMSNGKSKIKSIDVSLNETILSPRQKQIIRLKRQNEQLAHELHQIKTATMRSKEQLHRELQKCIRKAIDMKMEYEDLREDYDLLKVDYNDLRRHIKK